MGTSASVLSENDKQETISVTRLSEKLNHNKNDSKY